MKLNTSTLLQVAVWFVGIAPELVDMVPLKYAHIILGVAGLVSILLHRGAGKVNPDGTPAAVAYQPPQQ